MHIEGLIPFKSFTDQSMASLYFLRILINFYNFSTIKPATIITSCAILAPRKAYLRCLCNSIIINPSELFSTSHPFSSLLFGFSYTVFIQTEYCFF